MATDQPSSEELAQIQAVIQALYDAGVTREQIKRMLGGT